MSNDSGKKTLPSRIVVAKSTLPAKLRLSSESAIASLRKLELTKGLPPATVVYGCGAGVLFALALYFLVTGRWVNGLLTLLPASCFLGYALHFMKHGQ